MIGHVRCSISCSASGLERDGFDSLPQFAYCYLGPAPPTTGGAALFTYVYLSVVNKSPAPRYDLTHIQIACILADIRCLLSHFTCDICFLLCRVTSNSTENGDRWDRRSIVYWFYSRLFLFFWRPRLPLLYDHNHVSS